MSNPWKASAQFAAVVWFNNQEKTSPTQRGDAAKFARDNWVAFLPFADEGLGQLLLKVGRVRSTRKRQTVSNRAPIGASGRGARA